MYKVLKTISLAHNKIACIICLKLFCKKMFHIIYWHIFRKIVKTRFPIDDDNFAFTSREKYQKTNQVRSTDQEPSSHWLNSASRRVVSRFIDVKCDDSDVHKFLVCIRHLWTFDNLHRFWDVSHPRNSLVVVSSSNRFFRFPRILPPPTIKFR